VSEQPAIRAEKQRLRADLLQARRSAPVAARAAADLALQRHLLAEVRRQRATCVAAYSPMSTEPGGADLPAVLAALGVAVLLPVLRADLDLDWIRYPGTGPPGPTLPADAIAAAELVVVPAVAVDSTGLRLGRGGGSYDRALSRVRMGALVIALLYGGELVARVPAEPHDRRVSAVILPEAGLVHLPTFAGRTRAG
jgi:5-formyltetrahydrofolate cyclo-ligase